MSRAKEQVKQMIAKRQKSNSSHKKRVAKRVGVDGIVLEFMLAIEKSIRESCTALEFDFELQKQASILEDRVKVFDPYVVIAIAWNREDMINDWKELQIDTVKIIWSEHYLAKNPEKQKEKHISMISLFIDGKLDS